MKKLLAVGLIVGSFISVGFSAEDYIVINRQKQAGNQLVRLAEEIRDLRELSDRLNSIANHQNNGASYTTFINQFGIENSTTTAANLINLMGLLNNILNTNTDVTGANRKAQLDEFVARIAAQ